jgi:hypothetical protein
MGVLSKRALIFSNSICDVTAYARELAIFSEGVQHPFNNNFRKQ